jgi:RNA polymerase sigma-70 factor (ECF subfamily)
MVRAPSSVQDAVAPAATRMQALYEAHAAVVYRFLLQLTFGDRQAAEDHAQETMLRAWRNIEGFTTDIDTLRPWLLTVARRVAIDAGRAKKTRPAETGAVDLAILPDSGDAIDRMLGAQTIRQALAQLSPDHRNVIIEVYYHGRSAAEAGEYLGIPVGTVKSRTHHALRHLRAVLTARSALC